MLSINGQKSLQSFAVGLGLQLSNVDFPTRISNNKSLKDHCFSTNEQNTCWNICLPPLDINHIFFQNKLLLLENKTFLLDEIQMFCRWKI